MTRADPVLLTYGGSVRCRWPHEPRTSGSLHLPEKAKGAAGTTFVHALARALRLVWGNPLGGPPRSHVPGFLLVERDGTATIVDVGAAPGASPARGAAAWTVRENGWQAEAYGGPAWDRHGHRLAETVLGAPGGAASVRLLSAAAARGSGSMLLAAVTTPGDLLVVLPVLRAITAAARRADAAVSR